MNDEFLSAAELVNLTFNNLRPDFMKNASDIYDVWRKVLYRIRGKVNPNEGENLASHSRIIDLKNGVLLVEADHPGWIELLQLHKVFILKGMKMEKPEIEINSIVFRLKGKKAEIHDFERNERDFQDAQEKALKKLNFQEEKLKEMGFAENKAANTRKNEEMPPELKNLFDKLKSDMLTNAKNK